MFHLTAQAMAQQASLLLEVCPGDNGALLADDDGMSATTDLGMWNASMDRQDPFPICDAHIKLMCNGGSGYAEMVSKNVTFIQTL